MQPSDREPPAGTGSESRTLLSGLFPRVAYADWRATVEKSLRGASFERRLCSRTHDGLEIRPLYVREDLPPGPDPSGFPGMPPFTRHGELLGTTAGGWLPCQHYREAEPERVAAAVARDLRHSVRGVWIECDAATRAGLVPGDEAAAALCGVGGMSLACVQDLAAVLDVLDTDRIALFVDAGAAAPAAAALLAAAAAETLPRLRGGVLFDPIGVLAREGRLPWNPRETFAVAADLVAWARSEAPGMRTLAVSAAPFQEAGAGPAEELACTIAAGIDGLRRAAEAGVDPADAAAALLFDLPVGRDLFPSVARLRAARLLWDHVRRECGIGEEAGRMRLHARTSPFTKTRRDPWVNMIRATVEAFAAAVGGADSVAVSPFDEALGEPDELGRRIAANTHPILIEESHVHHVIDPAGGSHYIERLTVELAECAWELVREIERAGGMLEALRAGVVQARIAETAARRRRAIAERREPVTGVSIYPNLQESLPQRHRPEPRELAARRAATLAARQGARPAPAAPLPASRPGGNPDRLRAAARAAADGATLAGLWAAFGAAGGETAAAPLPAWREAEDFEALRDASDAFLQRTGRRPRIFLANIGPLARHKARADFTRNLVEAGGIEAIDRGGFDAPADAAAAFRESAAAAAAICGPDDAYPEFVPRLAPLLRQAGARRILLAGRPGGHEAAFREAGVDTFIHLGCDALAVLRDLLTELEVLP